MSEGKPLPTGGYFELELPARRALPHPGLTGFQSARAAFLALLRAGRPKRVWMPRYTCNAMLAPLEKAGIQYAWYDLTDELDVDAEVKLGSGDWLLYVNYFGICGGWVKSLMRRFPPAQIVLDYAQALFAAPHRQALATIYSPRKFVGVPDGGLIYSQIPLPPPDEVDAISFSRMEHLIKRLGASPEAGYAAFQEAEASLDDPEPRRMSQLSERILTSIDFLSVQRIRQDNFKTLHARLGNDNSLLAGMEATDVPLCYPYQSANAELRQHLIDKRIFPATYWNDALARLDPETADRLVRRLLPLPIDQRYDAADMARISDVILSKT